jgi:hypothetical protein
MGKDGELGRRRRAPSLSIRKSEADDVEGVEGEEAQEPRVLTSSWCSATVHERQIDVARRHSREGVCISHIPVKGSTRILVRLYIDSLPPSSDGSQLPCARQEPLAADTLVAWTSLSVMDEEEWAVRDGRFVLVMAAPPVDPAADFDGLVSKQEELAVLGDRRGVREWRGEGDEREHVMGERGWRGGGELERER